MGNAKCKMKREECKREKIGPQLCSLTTERLKTRMKDEGGRMNEDLRVTD